MTYKVTTLTAQQLKALAMMPAWSVLLAFNAQTQPLQVPLLALPVLGVQKGKLHAAIARLVMCAQLPQRCLLFAQSELMKAVEHAMSVEQVMRALALTSPAKHVLLQPGTHLVLTASRVPLALLVRPVAQQVQAPAAALLARLRHLGLGLAQISQLAASRQLVTWLRVHVQLAFSPQPQVPHHVSFVLLEVRAL